MKLDATIATAPTRVPGDDDAVPATGRCEEEELRSLRHRNPFHATSGDEHHAHDGEHEISDNPQAVAMRDTVKRIKGR